MSGHFDVITPALLLLMHFLLSKEKLAKKKKKNRFPVPGSLAGISDGPVRRCPTVEVSKAEKK